MEKAKKFDEYEAILDALDDCGGGYEYWADDEWVAGVVKCNNCGKTIELVQCLECLATLCKRCGTVSNGVCPRCIGENQGLLNGGGETLWIDVENKTVTRRTYDGNE